MKNKLMVLKARSARLATQGAVLVGTYISASEAMALDATQNTAITAAYDASGVSVGLIITGLITVVMLVTGFTIVYRLLNR